MTVLGRSRPETPVSKLKGLGPFLPNWDYAQNMCLGWMWLDGGTFSYATALPGSLSYPQPRGRGTKNGLGFSPYSLSASGVGSGKKSYVPSVWSCSDRGFPIKVYKLEFCNCSRRSSPPMPPPAMAVSHVWATGVAQVYNPRAWKTEAGG